MTAPQPGRFHARCNLTERRWERRLTAGEAAEAKANGYPRFFNQIDSERVDRETGKHGRWEIGFPACGGFETDDRAAYDRHMLEVHNRPLGWAKGYAEDFVRSVRAGWRSPVLVPGGKPLAKAVAAVLRTCPTCGLVAEVENNAGALWWAEHERGCALAVETEPAPEPAPETAVQSGAWLSDDRRYRYSLWRRWAEGGTFLTFVMLNPSIADADRDDPTIQRCTKLARRDGYSGLVVVNLYALVSTDPAGLWVADDPVGLANDEVLCAVLASNAAAGVPIVAAWGANAREDRVEWLLSQPGAQTLRCLDVTNAGAPKHPLARGRSRIPDDAPLVAWPVAS